MKSRCVKYIVTQENARLRESISEWVEAYANTLDERMAADRRRDDHGAYAANETVLADLDTLAALLAETGAKGGDDGK